MSKLATENYVDNMFQEVFKGTTMGREIFEDIDAKRKADDEHSVAIENGIISDLGVALLADYTQNNIQNPQEMKAICEDVVNAMCNKKIGNVTINY